MRQGDKFKFNRARRMLQWCRKISERRGPSGLAALQLSLRPEFQPDQAETWNTSGRKASKVDYQISSATRTPLRNASCGWRAATGGLCRKFDLEDAMAAQNLNERSSNSELGVVADGARWLRAMLRKCACVSQSISINFVFIIYYHYRY